MIRRRLVLLRFLVLTMLGLLTPLFRVSAADGLVVYKEAPGLPKSKQFKVRVRAVGSPVWKEAFAFETASKATFKGQNYQGYFGHLANWTHTYVNFETSGSVIIEISRLNNTEIRAAKVHPQLKANGTWRSDDKTKLYIRLDKPCLVAVDIDGQMDNQDTGRNLDGLYKGDPIHTISIFANPPLTDKPNINDSTVYFVKAGEKPPNDGPWKTLYFGPGIHDVGLAFKLRKNRQYYIPGDAIVYGTFNNGDVIIGTNGEAVSGTQNWTNGESIRIFGHGTLSGAKVTHPKYTNPVVPDDCHHYYRPIEVLGARNTRVEGITIADSANHSLMLANGYQPGNPNTVSWTKIITWRENGDGINPAGNTKIQDCFIRTQDDSLYVKGLGISRTVLWNDVNGSSFALSGTGNYPPDRPLLVEDCDVIYSRATWNLDGGRRVFNVRGGMTASGGQNVIFRNINIEDPRPTLQQFFICMTVPDLYAGGNPNPSKPGANLSGIHFENISIAKPNIMNEPQILWGQVDARIFNLTFKNLRFNNQPVQDSLFFTKNEFVQDLKFPPS